VLTLIIGLNMVGCEGFVPYELDFLIRLN